MENKKPDFDIIIRFLNFWDPTGEVRDDIEAGNVPEAYDSYAKEIHSMLENGCSGKALLRHLKMLQKETMTMPFDLEKSEMVASGLVSCFRENRDRFY